jgi:hypothetical protein
MTTVYDQMKDLLEEDPRARERRNKDRAIRVLLMRRHPELKEVRKEVLLAALREYQSYNRAWRKTTQENEHLRGKDYHQKFKLEDQKQAELGYNVDLSKYELQV